MLTLTEYNGFEKRSLFSQIFSIKNLYSLIIYSPSLRFPEFSGEWEEKKLGEVGNHFNYGMNASSIEFDGKNKYIRITDIDEESSLFVPSPLVSPSGYISDDYLVKEDDILFTRTGASTGKTYIYDKKDGKLFFAGFLIRMNVKKEFNSKFIFYQTKTEKYKQWVSIMSTRSGQPGINSQEYASFPITIPSLAEQSKIADFLTTLDGRISTQRELIHYYESLILWLSKMYFEKKDMDFSTKPLKTLCSIIKGQQLNTSELTENGEFYVMNGGIVPSGYHSKYNVDENTISISEGGNSCGYVQFNTEKFWSGGHCYTLHNIDESIKLKYFYYFLKFREKHIMKLRVGGALPNIQKKDLESFEIKFPTVEYQNEIVQILDSISEKIAVEKQLLSHYQEQKKYFLQNMFV